MQEEKKYSSEEEAKARISAVINESKSEAKEEKKEPTLGDVMMRLGVKKEGDSYVSPGGFFKVDANRFGVMIYEASEDYPYLKIFIRASWNDSAVKFYEAAKKRLDNYYPKSIALINAVKSDDDIGKAVIFYPDVIEACQMFKQSTNNFIERVLAESNIMAENNISK